MAAATVLRPYISVILAISADGKIADRVRSPARFGSSRDKAHLEARLAEADAVLFGAGTLRAYGTTLPLSSPALLEQRQQQGKSPQPVHIVCSQSGHVDPTLQFFRQAVPRWLLTSPAGAKPWLHQPPLEQFPDVPPSVPLAPWFEQVIEVPTNADGLDWTAALAALKDRGTERLAVTGGGVLVASLLALGAIDELWLTVCPLLLGGADAPTPVEGKGFLAAIAPQLELLSVEAIAHEVFLHYRVLRR